VTVALDLGPDLILLGGDYLSHSPGTPPA